MCRLSFIVPFYNVEPYIEECIRSLYHQDIPQSEYEVICVDDCSPDGSRAIAERLQKEYPTLRLLTHTTNKRQGGARNTGLSEARGRYIWFVDSDDQVCQNVLGNLLEMAEKNELDILQCEYVRSVDKCMPMSKDNGEIQDGETYLFRDNYLNWTEKISGPWMQIFRRQLLLDNHLEFIEGVQYEDTDYLLHAFIKAKKVQYSSICGYIYRENRSSTTLSVASPIKLAWMVNQLVRCAQFADMCSTLGSKECIIKMVSNSLSSLRREIKAITNNDKYIYVRNLSPTIKDCKSFMTWRTWLALRYGITWFI